MMESEKNQFSVGQMVTIKCAPKYLVHGLPRSDQKEIADCVGRPGVFVGIDPYGYLEIEFVLSKNNYKTVFVARKDVAEFAE